MQPNLRTPGCLNCGKRDDEKPMVYRGQPWCSENCKSEILKKESAD